MEGLAVLARVRAHLTYANVMATIAVFIALGGTAVAAGFVISKNSQLGPGTVSGSNPPAGKHNNVIGSSITGKDIKPDSVGGPRIIESSLGTVPSATSAANAGNANTLGGQPASNFLTINQSAGGDLSGGFSNLQLGPDSVGAPEIANVQRSVSIPLTSFIDCQTDGGAYLPFVSNADNADNIARFEVFNQDGSGPLIGFDANATAPDQNFEICSTFSVPADYASGGAFHVTGDRDVANTAEEDLLCSAAANSGSPDTATVVLDSQNVDKTCTPTFTPPLAAGNSMQFFLSITSPTTMDSSVRLSAVEFVYTAAQ
jgi:hypothetical protein